jgi:hypothetical protein
MAGTIKTLVAGVGIGAVLTGGTIISTDNKIAIPKTNDEISVVKDSMIAASKKIISRVDDSDPSKIITDTVYEPEKVVVVSNGEMVAHIVSGQKFNGAFILDGVVVDVIPFTPDVELPETDCWLAQARITFTQVRKPE